MSKSNIGRVANLPLSRRQILAGAAAVGAAGFIPQARAAGSIVVYSTTLPPIQKRLAEAFTKKTGITVQSLRLTTSPLAQRFLAEQKAGQHICDVVTLGHDEFFREVSAAGLLADIEDIPGVSTLPQAWRPGKRFTMILVAPHSIAYNTNLVTENSIPTGWQDVLKPEFTGQIIFPDPRANETLVSILVTLQEAYGDDFLRKLGEQKLRLVPAIPQGVEQVIGGEAKLMVPCLAMNLVQYQGTSAPIALIPTPSPTDGTYFYSAIAANAPNKEGARKWYEFVLSREGQEIICKDNGVSPLGEIPGSLKAPANFIQHDLKEALKKASHIYDLLGLKA
ncbi:conserved hypothetical protein [Hyphomicrobiales bacterium]|nr:conserved hypothetical protein [Hyphomicrobiales bacterium]